MSNPLLDADRWDQLSAASSTAPVMTVRGTTEKCVILFVLLLTTFGLAWMQLEANPTQVFGIPTTWALIGSAVLAIIAALVGGFAHRTAPVAAPIYALLKGVVLGIISWRYQQMYQGLPPLAAAFTITTLGGMLLLYNLRIVRATPTFIRTIVGATVGLLLGVGALALLNLFGVAQGATAALYGNGPIGIGFSILCVGLAAFNLIVDFHVIEEGERQRLCRHMEWVGALGLVVTLAWLYIEILRLLSKLRR
jgi:uncharacterized YccA/Bax inhibitor family protein